MTVEVKIYSLKHLFVQMMLEIYLNNFTYLLYLIIVGILNGYMIGWDFNHLFSLRNSLDFFFLISHEDD